MNPIAWAAFVVILYYCLCAAHRSSITQWQGPRWRFVALALSFASASSGALGVALDVDWSPQLLAAGAALYLLANRRTCINETREEQPQ